VAARLGTRVDWRAGAGAAVLTNEEPGADMTRLPDRFLVIRHQSVTYLFKHSDFFLLITR
jgi:hypothetical protein